MKSIISSGICSSFSIDGTSFSRVIVVRVRG